MMDEIAPQNLPLTESDTYKDALRISETLEISEYERQLFAVAATAIKDIPNEEGLELVINEAKKQGWTIVFDHETNDTNIGVYSRTEKEIIIRPKWLELNIGEKDKEYYSFLIYEVAHETLYGNAYHEGIERGGDFRSIMPIKDDRCRKLESFFLFDSGLLTEIEGILGAHVHAESKYKHSRAVVQQPTDEVSAWVAVMEKDYRRSLENEDK